MARDEPHDYEKCREEESDGNHCLRNGKGNIRSQTSLVEYHELSDHGPSEDHKYNRGREKDEFRNKIERNLYFLWHETHNNIHPNMPARPSNNGAAKKHAANH